MKSLRPVRSGARPADIIPKTVQDFPGGDGSKAEPIRADPIQRNARTVGLRQSAS